MTFEFRLILAIFTCYRLARLISRDDGPSFLFSRIRFWAKDKALLEAEDASYLDINPKGVEEINERHFGKWHNLSEALSCPYCLGVWFSLPLLGLVLWPSYWGDVFLILMTISGVQAWLWGMANK